MRRRGLRIATETRPAHSLQQKLRQWSLMSSEPSETNNENSSKHHDQTDAHRVCCKPPFWRLAWIALSFDQAEVRTVCLATVPGGAIQRGIIPIPFETSRRIVGVLPINGNVILPRRSIARFALFPITVGEWLTGHPAELDRWVANLHLHRSQLS